MKSNEEIKKNLKEGKLIIGLNRTVKELKAGNIEKIYIAKDCPKKMKNKVVSNAKISKTEVKNYISGSRELGTICKKPFQILVLSIKK